MGFFDFLKGKGAKLLKKGDEAEKVQELLQNELGDAASGLQVDFKDGLVSLKGDCNSKAVKEKAILLAGNLNGVAQVSDDAVTVAAQEEEEETEFYTIQSGDSLSKIAKKYYGSAQKYPVIFEANREVIKEANLIYPGQTIRIPKLDA